MNIYASLPVGMAMRFLREEHGLNEVDYWCVMALFRNQDWEGVRKQLEYRSKKKVASATKFIPGKHFHALGKRFATLNEAIEHIEEKGFRYNGLREHFVYRPE